MSLLKMRLQTRENLEKEYVFYFKDILMRMLKAHSFIVINQI